MDLSRGYTLQPAAQERMRLLDWIYDHGGTAPRQIVDLGPLFQGLGRDEELAVAGHLEALESDGLLRLQKTLEWETWSGDVQPRGIDFVEELRNRRNDRLARRQAARDAFLRWLYDCTLNGEECPNSGDFPDSRFGTYYGDPFTDADIEPASEWLRDEGYLNGKSFYGGGVVRPVITTKGQKIVESGRSVNDEAHQPAPYSVTTVNVTGSGNNIAANASNVTQTTTVTMTEDNSRQLLGLAESLAQLTNSGLLGLNDEHTREAALVVESLRETAAQEKAPGSDVRTLLDRVKAVALAGTGTAIGQTLVAAAEQVIQALGLGG